MERDFKYLADKYGIPGARDIFEKICTELMQIIYKDAYQVKADPGDDGIDVFTGDINKKIVVYQCKYFLEGIEKSQKQQVNESFNTAIKKNNVERWILCIPCILNKKEHVWWSEWKNRNQNATGVIIELYDGSRLINMLKKNDLYERVFDDDIRLLLNEISEYLTSEKNKIFDEIIYEVSDDEIDDYDECVFVKKLENANIFDNNECRNDFFNAEIVYESLKSKDDKKQLDGYKTLKRKIHSVWNTQYRLHASEDDGNDLLSHTYMRIEDLDTSTLKSIDEVSLIAKKGILHQLAEECSVGWIKDYRKKLEKGEDE